MRFYVLACNGECRIIRASLRAPLSEINKLAFGIAYGVDFIGSDAREAMAIGLAREAGFREAIINDVKTSIELVGVSGVA